MSAQEVVVLDRVEPGKPEPDYCIHGRATCMGGCGEWVWLGDQTYKLVESGKALPLCKQCAKRLIAPQDQQPIGHVQDNRRADGPHA